MNPFLSSPLRFLVIARALIARAFIVISALFPVQYSTAAVSESKTDNCSGTDRLRFAATGDILMHLALQVQSQRVGDFSHMWQRIDPVINSESIDILYANLESPIAESMCEDSRIATASNPCDIDKKRFPYGGVYDDLMSQGYTNTPRINVHPDLISDLQGTFEILGTANNHAMDRGPAGLASTLSALELNGYRGKVTGTRVSENDGRSWFAAMERNNISVAVAACTTHTNGLYETSSHIMRCFDTDGNANRIYLDLLFELAAKYDAVIAAPHWGVEYSSIVDSNQQKFTRQLFYSGAMVVLGTHPHVVQSWHIEPGFRDRHGMNRDRFVIYSLGNFIANQGSAKQDKISVMRRTGIVLALDLCKKLNGTHLCGASYFPYYITTSSNGPQKRRVAIGFDDTIVKKSSSLTESVRIADRYINSVLPAEYRIKLTEEYPSYPQGKNLFREECN